MAAVGEGVMGCSDWNLQEREGEEAAPQHDIGVRLKLEGELTERGKNRQRVGGRAWVSLVQ
jgi:hypothetical protein